MATYKQEARRVKVKSALGDDVLLFYRMLGSEEMGRPFRYELDLLCETKAISSVTSTVEKLLGSSITVSMQLPGGGERYFNGLVSEVRLVGRNIATRREDNPNDLLQFHVVLRPWLWFLTRTANCRIFQEKTVPDIIKAVFEADGYSDYKLKLSATYRTWDYCVQYRESDFDFVSRLMEQEGIYYYFTYDDGKHTLVLADSYSAHEKTSGYEKLYFLEGVITGDTIKEGVLEWRVAHELQSGTYSLRDFDFEKPKADLSAKSQIKRKHAHAGMEVYDYPGEYVVRGDGDNYAKVRIEGLQANYQRAIAESNLAGVVSGALFSLEEFPIDEQNREYLVVAARYELESNDYLSGSGGSPEVETLKCSFTSIDSKQPYRAAPITPKPIVQGPQTAIVVGKSGEEIWTDKYGRVKVQFHWDREGKNDENSSCWIRVAQLWGGKTWGGMHIPRIGQEVIVDFLEGDPDRPIITGRVYNADQMPPYGLPDNKTQSGIKSRSTKSGDGNTFNELRFEDKKGSEEVYFHAEKDFDRVVENNDTLKVGFDKKDAGDQTIDIYNNRTTTLDQGNEKLEVKTGNREVLVDKGNDTHTVSQGNRKVTVSQGNDTHTISQGNRQVSIDLGNDTLTVAAGNRTVKVSSGKESHEAGQAIELKVGSSSIKIEPAAITLSSTQIKITGQAQVQVSAPMVKVNGSGMVQVQGGLVKIN